MELGPPLEESAEELFDEAPCGYLTTLADGGIVRVNGTFLSWTGYSREHLLGGARFKDLLTTPSRIYFDTHIAPLLKMQSFVREVAFDVTRPGRDALPVLMNATRRKAASDKGPLIRITLFDATDRRKYEQELLQARRIAERATETERSAREESERANRAKDEFLALVSHELRAPLGAILGWSQVLRARNPTSPEILRGLDVIERNTQQQARLIDDLLDMSRMLSGKLRLDVQRVNLSTVIDSALETAQPAAQARGLRVQTILDPNVTVSGDPGRLQQVFWNLLSNAVKFTPRDGSIRVVMERVNSHIEVSVIDSGQGMSQEFLAHAFERFRQSDTPQAHKNAGLGLGLSIVKNIVEMHGGSIEAHSAGQGQGSTFTIKLPLVIFSGHDPQRVHPDSPLVARSSRVENVDLRGLKLVVIDDEEDVREAISYLLMDYGADITAVSSAAEGLRAVEAIRPDVLVSDIGMPGEDGYELMRRVRLLGEAGATPAIALTAFSRLEDRTRAMLSGFQMHLTKPVDTRELVVAVASLAGRLGKK